MTVILTSGPSRTTPIFVDPSVRLAAQTDTLIDTISGTECEGLPVPAILDRLCAQLRAMGMEPDLPKVLRLATWISGPRP